MHVEDLDPAQQSLADALRVSFMVLKVAMLILLVVYLFSGFFNVRSDEVAFRLRFGEIVQDESGNDKVIPAGGPHFAFPYPIEQVIRVSRKPREIRLQSEFMYENPNNLSKEQLQQQAAQQPLNPEKSGSLLTADANIIHSKFSVLFQVIPAQAGSYVKRVGNEQTADAIVRKVAEQAIVYAAAQVTTDEVVQGRFPAETARLRMNEVLSGLETGLEVVQLTFAEADVPLAVRPAYQAVITAEQERARVVEEAYQNRDRILAEAAGAGTRVLVDLINRYEVATAAQDQATVALLDERLDWIYGNLQAPLWVAAELPAGAEARAWELLRAAAATDDAVEANAAREQLAALLAEHNVPPELRLTQPITGEAALAINQAKEFRSTQRTLVEADVERFQRYYSQYQGNPELRGIIMSRLWQQAKQEILGGDVETIYLPPGQVYPVINRDPNVARERERRALQRGTDEQRRAAAGNVATPTNPAPPRPPAPPPPPAGGGGDGDGH